MPKARPEDFREEFRMLDGEGIKEQRIESVEAADNEITALDYDTVIDHFRRNGYDVTPSPNGGSRDIIAQDDIKEFDVSVLEDDAVQIRFSMDIEEAEERRGKDIGDPKAYVEKVYDQIVEELVERERKLERASESYVSDAFESDNPVEKVQNDFQKHGDSISEIVDSYFSDMRPSDLGINYAVHFELYPGETADQELTELKGKMPLTHALGSQNKRERNSLYLRRFLGKVLQKTDGRKEISGELEEYWEQLQ